MATGGNLVATPVTDIPKYAGGGGSKTGKSDQALLAFIDAEAEKFLALTYANKGSATSMVGTIRKKIAANYPDEGIKVAVGPCEGGHGVYLSR